MLALLWFGPGCTGGDEPSLEEGTACALTRELTSVADGVSASSECAAADWSIRSLNPGLSVSFEVTGGTVTPTVTATSDAVFTGLAIAGPWTLSGDADAVWWRQGYQSWSWSGVTAVVEPELDGLLPLVEGDGDGASVLLETPSTSWWVSLIGRADGASLLTGAVSADTTKVWFAASEEEHWVVWGARGEAIALASGESLTLDPVWIAVGEDPWQMHRDYASVAAAAVPPGPLDTLPPLGWVSWYAYYGAVTEEDVRANLAVLAARDDVPAGSVLQIDDGWQVRWGDWTANDSFPSGMSGLAAEIEAAGFTPGLWMAPFYVHRDTDVFLDHDDWWVREASGEVVTFSNFGTGDYAILDVTHPDAAEWLSEQISGRVADGYRYLKLDFLYAGAQEGLRFEDVTGAQAYQRGLTVLREAAGDAWILACGAPMLPTLGIADSYRTGPDIAFSASPNPNAAFLRSQAKNTAARGWQNGLWWWVDPDPILVGDELGAAGVRGAVVANAVSGGAWFLGDDLTTISEERLDAMLAPGALASRGAVVRPVDPLSYVSGFDAGPLAEALSPDDQVPLRWQFDDGTEALLNLSASDAVVTPPGGTEQLTGADFEGEVTLVPGDGQIWR